MTTTRWDKPTISFLAGVALALFALVPQIVIAHDDEDQARAETDLWRELYGSVADACTIYETGRADCPDGAWPVSAKQVLTRLSDPATTGPADDTEPAAGDRTERQGPSSEKPTGAGQDRPAPNAAPAASPSP